MHHYTSTLTAVRGVEFAATEKGQLPGKILSLPGKVESVLVATNKHSAFIKYNWASLILA